MRFACGLALLLAVVAVHAGCEPAPITTSPDCHASVLHHRVLGWPRLRTVVVAIDPSVGEVLDAERVIQVRDALRDAVDILVTGDRGLDGERDFGLDEGVRVVVMTTDGAVHLDSVPPPSTVPTRARPVVDPWIELWPDVADEAWTRWFVDVTAARIETALAARVVDGASAVESILALSESVPSVADPDWPAHVILVTTRDHAFDSAMVTRWSAGLPGSSVSLLAAFREAASVPPFEPLLGTQPFDESAVPCASSELVGVYPRGLVALARDLTLAGHAVTVSSLCDFGPSELIDAAVARIAEPLRDPCLPFPLTLRADGTPPCVVELTPPASGRGTSCLELGLTLSRESRDARGRQREVCSVPAVPPGDIARVPGFFYDDFSTDLADTCGPRPYRIAFTPALDRPAGASVELWCEEGSAACGFEIVSTRVVPRDAGHD